MAVLMQGSCGAQVTALQNGLIALGFLAGPADAAFGPATALALRDLQRRLLLKPDGLVGPRTQAALAAALAGQPPSPTSAYGPLRREAEELARQGLADDDHLPLLDRGLAASPFREEPPHAPARLAAAPEAAVLVPYPAPLGRFADYPAHGVVPSIVTGTGGRGGLEFLSEDVAQACVCVGSFGADQPLKVRWYGRRALEDNVQFWSATKFIAPLHLVCQLNRRRPGVPIEATSVRSLEGGHTEAFATLFRDMVSYAPRAGEPDGGGSNRIAYLFKRLGHGDEPDLQTWLRKLSGNPRALLLGWHGQWQPPRDRLDLSFRNPFRTGAELIGPDGVLLPHRSEPRTRNLVSAYDLVRMLTLLGWHHQLDPDQRLPGAQWSSLATLVEGLGHDTARYLDLALERLGLLERVCEPVILSKMGFGAETGDPEIDALCYAAFACFRDTRSRPHRQRCFALALRVPARPGAALEADARMGAEVTELVRRIFAEELV